MSDRFSELKIILAGFNLDAETIFRLYQAAIDGGEPPDKNSLTPETISAAYARISRDPAEIPNLRAQARQEIEQARKSNENIIFGFGHSSVAEHAVFNLDILGISRLAVEAIEAHRLASYTEKSQRYIKLDGGFVLPTEIQNTPFEKQFLDLIQLQNDTYFYLLPKLTDYFYKIYKTEGRSKPKIRAETTAGEDARYVLSLATQTQLGMTINARSVEVMIRRSLAHPLAEVRLFGRRLGETVQSLAPSLIKYIETTPYELELAKQTCYWADEAAPDVSGIATRGSVSLRACETAPDVSGIATRGSVSLRACETAPSVLGAAPGVPAWGSEVSVAEDARLIDVTTDGEKRVMAALLGRREALSLLQAFESINSLNPEEKHDLISRSLENLEACDPPPREFELMDFMMEVILSATAFAQFKRHRMATLLPGPYNPGLGWTVPPSIQAIHETQCFTKVMNSSTELARHLAEINPALAAYTLTNAHRRRCIFKANARELYHFSRLREDIHAQWDIRALANRIIALARQAAPTLMMMAAGKHEFARQKESVFGSK